MKNDPFAKLGAIDQKLFQQPATKPVGGEPPATDTQPTAPALPVDNQDASKPANPQADKQANLQTRKPANPKTRLHANPQTGKLATVEKYSTYMRPDSIKEIKRIALETDRKDYEVLDEAVSFYLQHHKNEP